MRNVEKSDEIINKHFQFPPSPENLSSYEIMRKKQTALLHSHNNDDRVKAPQCYVLHTLPILFAMTTTLGDRLYDQGIVVLITLSKPVLGPNHLQIQQVPGVPSSGIKGLQNEGDLSPLSSVQATNE
jgi:hypothetical protein